MGRIGRSGMGMKKHGKSGKAASHTHFTGKKRGKKIKRKGKGLTHKQRLSKRGSHKNRYQHKEKAD